MSLNYNQKADEIYADLLINYIPFENSDSKFALYTMGIPASGKTTSAKFIIEQMGIPKDSIIFLDPDDVMSKLEGYSDSLKGEIYKNIIEVQ